MSHEVDDTIAQAEENDVNYKDRLSVINSNDEIDAKYGFEKYTGAKERNAWLINVQPSEVVDEQTRVILSAVDFYFVEESGDRFRITMPFRPYFFIACSPGTDFQVAAFLTKKYNSFLIVEHLDKEDLDLKNHLSGLKRSYLKLSFPSTAELNKLKRDLMPLVRKNKERIKNESQYSTILAKNMGAQAIVNDGDVLKDVIDIREYDVALHMRLAIDEKLFVGKWYVVRGLGPNRAPTVVSHPTMIDPIDPVVLAFDIETTKLPLKFPDRETDEIMMISYMVDGHGFLITNRQVISADVENFEYTPKDEYRGDFTVWNEANEIELIKKFFQHILEVRPNIIATYNGDFFDWPFVEARAKFHGLDMATEIGFVKDAADEYKCRNCSHLDVFRWVKRDSYLPMGSQNLKAVAKAKLRYDPVEVDPEDMCKMAREDPQAMSNYSVSDAVATYYLYMKYVHPFIFALCTIIPLGPDDVLRKGSGTLCEALLMVEAFHNNIIFPNKYTGSDEVKMSKDGHRIESETYVGGHVEALQAGVFRADIPCRFRLVPFALKMLQTQVQDTIAKELIREFGIPLEQVVDFEDKCKEVQEQFAELLRIPNRLEKPRIYHLDVGAMYPNIILTNRLQPCAMVDEEVCLACKYNKENAACKRTMDWEWRGELTPAHRGELQQIQQQLEGEWHGNPKRPFHQLPRAERETIEKKRVQDFSRRAYGKTRITRTEKRSTMICQRENAFYVDTVRAFRDRRYEYKELLKKAKGALEAVSKDDVAAQKAAQGRIVLYESLQLAHKCILNSFYGYVMRKGSRWFSMEMAGIVCYTGANIITQARKLVEQIGTPLELDTDGIWCLLPASFPENITFQLQNSKRKSVTVSYPGAMLNALVNEEFTNDQYHNLQSDGSYTVSKENSIFFEVDGPYQCMVLPASKEEGKKLKKRYAVFNLDGSLAELKGFEVKRRGELNIIKHFQSAVFKAFLRGNTLQEVYDSVARGADYWLDVLFSKGVNLTDADLFELISENKTISKKLEDYGQQKSTSISTAKRLAEFLGDSMIQNTGLSCQFVISRHPIGSPVTERAVPIAIFQADAAVAAKFLRQWTKQMSITPTNMDIREILDWDYYIERLGSCIQKIITIPAALQGVENPVPRIAHPDWLRNKLKNKVDSLLQPKITDIFQRSAKPVPNENGKRPRDPSDITNEPSRTADVNNKDTQKRSRNTQIDSDVLTKKTLRQDGFDSWLVFLKAKWRQQRKERRAVAAADRQQNSNADRVLTACRNNVKERTWQILSIEETNSPGYFSLWVASDSQMHRYSLRILRTLLVNKREPHPDRQVKRKVLPHRKKVHFLYEFRTDEAQCEMELDSLNAELCSADVEGLYESQVPAMFRALVQMGCICRCNAAPINGTYELENFRMVSLASSDTTYLTAGSVRTVFVYKFSHNNAIHVWCVMDPSTSEGHMIVAHRGGTDFPNMDRIYSTAFVQEEKSSSLNGVRETMKFDTKVMASTKDAEKEVGKVFRTIRESTTRPTLLVLLVDESSAALTKRVPNFSLFPHVRLHIREPSNILASVDWQRTVARRIVKQFFNSFIYLDDYCEWARYLHIPIGNIPSDMELFAIDLFFARHLQMSSQVLWASPMARPDLGGKEMDDMRLSINYSPLCEDKNILLNESGLYDECCVQLQLGAMAICALVQRSRLLDAEGADDGVVFDSNVTMSVDAVLANKATLSTYDEGAAVDSALKTLKAMMSECLREIQMSNKRADSVALSLSRWLHSPTALLYDPALSRSVAVLERKLVLLLATECQRLGTRVVHATPQRLVLATSKRNSEDAKEMAALLISSLKKNPLFAAVGLRIEKVWCGLLWLDGSNYTGISDGSEFEGEEEEEEEEDEKEKPKNGALNHWRISEVLDDNVKEEFLKIVSVYTAMSIQKGAETGTEEALSFRSNMLRSSVSQRVFKVLSKLMEERNDESASALAQTLVRALRCDTACSDDVDGLHENIQRLLRYAPEECETSSLFVSDVFCQHCKQSSDIDIADTRAWNCADCNTAFDVATIDDKVSERINHLLSSYLLQDQSCGKCRNVRSDNLSKNCNCCGPYNNTVNAESLQHDVRLAQDVAEKFNLPRTLEMTSWIMAAL